MSSNDYSSKTLKPKGEMYDFYPTTPGDNAVTTGQLKVAKPLLI